MLFQPQPSEEFEAVAEAFLLEAVLLKPRMPRMMPRMMPRIRLR